MGCGVGIYEVVDLRPQLKLCLFSCPLFWFVRHRLLFMRALSTVQCVGVLRIQKIIVSYGFFVVIDVVKWRILTVL